MGINVDKYIRSNLSSNFPKDNYEDELSDVVKKELQKITIKKKIVIGKTRSIEADHYIDLIGASTNPEIAHLYARYLSTYWHSAVKDKNKVTCAKFHFVVTPKDGSPILGYEFAKLINKPFVLHENNERIQCNEEIAEKRFNSWAKLPKKSVALIVDDSTTGGRMVTSLIEDLRKFGYEVNECLVVFEPKLKDARAKLKDLGVNLNSIVVTHDKKD